MKNYYYILGLQNNASEQDVRIAYKKLSMLLHPDRNGGDRSKEKQLQAVVEAYQLLKKSGRE